MDGRRITLTPRAMLRFDSLGFVYTGAAESDGGRTFARPPRPNVLARAAGHEAFVRGFSDDVIVGMLGPNPTQERFRLAAYYLTDLTFQASGDELLAWGEFMERYTTMYPRGQPGLPDDPMTAYVNDLCSTGAASGSTMTQRARTTRRHDPRRNATSPWPPPRAASNRSQLRASSTRRWPFFTKSWAWMPSHATDGLHKISLCRRSPVREMATGVSAVRLPTSRTAAHQRHRRAGRHATTTDAPTRERMWKQTLTLTHRHTFGGRRRILPLRPCCCAAARRWRPPRNDECANS
jgi:hypothetical protein